MPVLKQHHTRDFTVVPNDLLKDRRLSLRDIGLLVWMLSKPPDWKFTYEGMLAELETDGKSALQKSVKSLQSAKYLKIEKKRHKGRLSESIWYVYDSPYIENQYMVNQPQTQNATEVSPHIDSPYTVNQSLLNKDNTKDTATKNAVPALMGGVQLGGEYYYQDPITKGYVRKENP